MHGGLVLSFRHAFRGLVEVTARERNMKLHVLAGTAVGLLGSQVELPFSSRAALLVATSLVIAGELGNSALEALVDLHTREWRDEARRVKDAAAGGVLVLAAGAVLTGVAVALANRAAIEEAFRTRGPSLATAAGAVALEALLLFRRGRSVVVDAIVAGLGGVLVAVLGVRGTSGALSLAAALLFALAAAAAGWKRRKG